MTKSTLTKNQKKRFTNDSGSINKAVCVVNGVEYRKVILNIGYDDDCGNGHNSFSMTGEAWCVGDRLTDDNMACGCIHDILISAFPEYSHLIKWHLVSSDEPMYYLENTLYHARDTDTKGKKVGEPIAFDTVLKFDNIPFTFKEFERGFFEYLKNTDTFESVKVEAVHYDGKDSYDFGDNFTLSGFDIKNSSGKWYGAPFTTKGKAEEFLTALQNNKFNFISKHTKWCKAVKPNIEAARSSAVWHDATLEQLQSVDQLKARLPQLMSEFKKDIESLDFIF